VLVAIGEGLIVTVALDMTVALVVIVAEVVVVEVTVVEAVGSGAAIVEALVGTKNVELDVLPAGASSTMEVAVGKVVSMVVSAGISVEISVEISVAASVGVVVRPCCSLRIATPK
jgi:hypothetical protein